MKVNVYHASGIVLDYLVTKIEEPYAFDLGLADWREQRRCAVKNGEYLYRWSGSYNQGMPILEQRRIGTNFQGGEWIGVIYDDPHDINDWDYRVSTTGSTILEAGLRCHVISILGFEVDVPEELLACAA